VLPEEYLPLALILLTAGTFLGGLVPLLRRWSVESLSLLLSFGSGVILAVIFLQMIPATFQLTGTWGGAGLLAGFILTSLLESEMHAHRRGGGREHRDAHFHVAGMAVAVGLALHSVMDGLVLGAGMSLSELAPSVFFAILIHKGPDAFALTTVLLAAGLSVRRILAAQALFSLATPLAAVASLGFLVKLPAAGVGVALGVAAGTLLAVVSEDLLPEVHRRRGKGFAVTVLALVAGIGVVVLYVLILD
jgi:zinc and cadmium transporter